MICSMTGFGRCELTENNRRFSVELKSVNHKYVDINIKMPRKFNLFDAKIRNLFKQYASRGKVDIFINYEDLEGGSESLRYNSALAKEYYDYYMRIKDEFSIDADIHASTIARCPDVLVLEEQELNEEELWPSLEKALTGAFEMFRASRLKEGESLKNDIFGKLDEMEEHTAFVERFVPQIVSAYRSKLEARVHEFLEDSQIDDSRIAAEVTIYADKIAVDEELVRLQTHIRHMRDILDKGGDIGRNLDFIAQEMNREANTILSKSGDIEVTNRGIELKTCIEKIREQVQNIE